MLWQDNTLDKRTAIIQAIAREKHLEELAVEKDWWVTATLKALFSTSFSDYMLFKGGTSLSKGWKDIGLKRLSEDIDISVSRRWFLREEVREEYPFASCETNSQIKLLRKALRKVIFERLSPELGSQLDVMGIKGFRVVNVTEEGTAEGREAIATDRDPVVINVEYESIVQEGNPYITPKVKIEISCLSMDAPTDVRPITSLICDRFPDVDDGTACEIPTVLPLRTFMEKAFLLNEEYQKNAPRAERMSRHLYDLEKMMDGYPDKALDAIIAHWKKFYHTHWKKFYHIGTVDYGKDQREFIHLWPKDSFVKEYEKDYKSMTDSFIYDTAPLSFEELGQRIRLLEMKFKDVNE